MNTARLFLWHPADDSYLAVDDSLDVPAIEVSPSARIPRLAARWCHERRVRASFITTIGGVGCADGSVHWGVWLRADDPAQCLRWLSLERIEFSTDDPVTRRLATALHSLRGALPPSWIGANPYWAELVLAWIARRRRGHRIGPLVPIRADGGTIVARCTVGDGSEFFTARALPFDDSELCDALNAHAPGMFPHTRAYDASRHYWLTADVGGSDAQTFLEGGSIRERLSDLMAKVADAQVGTIGARDVRRLSFDVSLASIRDGVRRAIDDGREHATWTPARRAAIQSGIDRLWAGTVANAAPAAWVHSDPSPDNVRVADDGTLRFIDMEDPWYGPALLMGALALHSMSQRFRSVSQPSSEPR